MTVIKLTKDCYVQPQAILILQKEPGLVSKAPAEIRAEWDARPSKGNNPYEKMLLPAIKAVLVEQKDVMIHFASEEARDKHLAMLVNKWKAA